MLYRMKLPAVRGIIERWILTNFRVDADVLARVLPAPFRPKLANGQGVAGICLIRLGEIRPRWLPRMFGTSSENAAHRVAVAWDGPGGVEQGVYIPRRDTSSRLYSLVGGRLFSGEHHLARFEVRETEREFRVAMSAPAAGASLLVEGRVDESLFPRGSIEFDCALLMRDHQHEWLSREPLCCSTGGQGQGDR